FTSADTTAPTLASHSPTAGAEAVTVTDNLILTFSEAVFAGSGGTINLYKSDNSLVESFAVDDLDVVSGLGTDTLTIDSFYDLDSAGVGYYVTIDATALTDEAGNAFAGITGSTTWTFTSADTVAPTITDLYPVDDSTDVGITENLVLTFDEAVIAGSGSLILYQSGESVSIIESFELSTTTRVSGLGTYTLTIDPTLDLDPTGVSYYLLIESDALTDLSGNAYTEIVNLPLWNFTSEDTTAPSMISFSPRDADGSPANAGATDNLVITLDEAVFAGTGSVNIYNSDFTLFESIDIQDNGQVTGLGTEIITLAPSKSLDANGAEYYVTVDSTALADSSGNYFAGVTGISDWIFTTADVTAPTILSVSPADEASSHGLTDSFSIVFSEAVTIATTGSINLHRSSDSSLAATLDVTNTQLISGDGTDTITFGFDATLDISTDYYLLIDAGAFKDDSDNDFAGIIGASDWHFTSAGPTVTLSIDHSIIGETGVATVTATLSAISSLTVTVDLVTSGTATIGTDYTLSSSQLTFEAGTTTATTEIFGNQGALDAETVIVAIDTVSNGTEDGEQTVTTMFDTTAPTLADIALADGFDTGNSSSDLITNVDIPKFTGTTEAGATVSITIPSAQIDLNTTADVSGNWNILLSNLSDGDYTAAISATDSYDNTSTENVTFTIDTTAPSASNVAATEGASANMGYSTGDTLQLTVTMNEAVWVTGVPSLTLATGGTLQSATYVSGSGTDSLIFNYTVQAEDASSDLALSTNIISLNGGSLEDTAGNTAWLTLPSPGVTGSLSANQNISINPSISFTQTITESFEAEGQLDNDLIITLTNDTFRGTVGSTFSDIQLSGLPSGITSTAILTADNQITVSFSGVTTSTDAGDITSNIVSSVMDSQFSFVLNDTAFTNSTAASQVANTADALVDLHYYDAIISGTTQISTPTVLTGGSYIIEFTGGLIDAGDKVDLTGFGTDDKIAINTGIFQVLQPFFQSANILKSSFLTYTLKNNSKSWSAQFTHQRSLSYLGEAFTAISSLGTIKWASASNKLIFHYKIETTPRTATLATNLTVSPDNGTTDLIEVGDYVI
ncbi:MAG: Ig-like domain-containing protein, partial [Magnetococcales bacterium]|nr:Ig-like domain-containing protein [Magnetococcales bacterium]